MEFDARAACRTAVLPLLAPTIPGFPTGAAPVTAAALWGAVWPLLAGVLVFALALRVPGRARCAGSRAPPGDLLVPVEGVLGWAGQGLPIESRLCALEDHVVRLFSAGKGAA